MSGWDSRTDSEFAIIAEDRNALRISHPSAIARHAGVEAGMSVTDARAICPELTTEPTDPFREGALLRALVKWADRLSPLVALDPPDGLLVDISGCAHLFGGETAMATHIRDSLMDMSIASQVGIADTKGAARALARYGAGPVVKAKSGRTAEALATLPLVCLDMPNPVESGLRRAGLKTVGQLYGIKSSELARRFGLELTNRLAKALGHSPDPISLAATQSSYAARMTLPDPIGLLADLEAILTRLAAAVCARLEADELGARQFHLTVRCVDTGDQFLTVGFASPTHAPQMVCQQFTHALQGLEVEFGADWFRLTARNVEPVQSRQTVMGRESRDEESVAKIISTLGNRLGFDRVRRFVPIDSYLPEREFETVEAAHSSAEPVWSRAQRQRPLRLFSNPERIRTLQPGRPPHRFEWRRVSYEMRSAKGPERLTPEWWRDGDGRVRDYWIVQTVNGARLWLMTYPGKRAPDWFVAGRFP